MKHGTAAAYKTSGCRCGECRAANRDAMRDYRAGVRAEYRGRPAGPRARVIRAARAALASVVGTHNGHTDFDELCDQEPIAELARALAELDALERTRP